MWSGREQFREGGGENRAFPSRGAAAEALELQVQGWLSTNPCAVVSQSVKTSSCPSGAPEL